MWNRYAMINGKAALVLALVLGGLGACTSRDAATTGSTAQTTAKPISPLVGTWTRDGDSPKPNPKEPQFTELTFTADGSLEAMYVAAGRARERHLQNAQSPKRTRFVHDSGSRDAADR
jgi:hypothetical protein